MKLTPLTPAIGTIFSDINITHLNDSELSFIKETLVRSKVIFFKNQSISIEQLLLFSQHFGELMTLPYIKPMDEFPQVIRVLKKAEEINMGVFGGDWHSDFSFLAEPPRYSILLSEVIPPQGGDTLWINMASAWDKLDQQFKESNSETNRSFMLVLLMVLRMRP